MEWTNTSVRASATGSSTTHRGTLRAGVTVVRENGSTSSIHARMPMQSMYSRVTTAATMAITRLPRALRNTVMMSTLTCSLLRMVSTEPKNVELMTR